MKSASLHKITIGLFILILLVAGLILREVKKPVKVEVQLQCVGHDVPVPISPADNRFF